MSAEARQLLERALALSEAERAVMVDVLSDSLRGANGELGPEWRAEITRRIAAVERGESRLIPGDEVEARIRAKLQRI
jgi:putative addiction module component (TIGR02574 family)